jgi:ligand-binding SRPBCC domain-containing protein
MSVKLEYSTLATCSPEAAWKLFAQTDLWAQWTPFIQSARWISGEPWQQGSEIELTVTQPPLKLKGKLVECKPPYVCRIDGGAMGLTVQHEFAFVEQGDKTLMATRMTLNGPATMFINDGIKDRAVKGFAQWFERLKGEAESNRAIG